MAKKRFTDIEIWDREWYMELTPTHKCLMKYIFDKCDASGCWKPNWKLASLHIGEKVEFSDLKKLPDDQYEILDNGKIFIPDFIKFQYGKLSKKSPAHNPIFLAIEKNNLSDRVFNRVSDTLKEKEEEKEEEEEEEEDCKKKFFLMGLYEKKYSEVEKLFPELREDEFEKWREFIDVVYKNNLGEVFKYRAINPIDFNKLTFPKDKWVETIKAILATGIKKEHNLYFRIPQFLEIVKDKINGRKSINGSGSEQKLGTSAARVKTANGW